MNKYISETDLKKYLDKQLKEAVRLRDLDGISITSSSYWQGQIDQIEEIAEELDLTLWV